MKALLALACLAMLEAAVCVTPVRGAAASLDTASISGRDYVPVGEWARANAFTLQWLKRDQRLALVRGPVRLALEVNSKDAEVNGIIVRLSFPVAFRDGTAWVSKLDVTATLQPLLLPRRHNAGGIVKTIVLDPGHGGKDPGFLDGSHAEKKYTLLLAQELAAQLKRAGFKVTLTRTGDSFIDLPVRPDIARRRQADLFISLHWNSAGTGRNDVKGAQTFCLTPPGAPSSNGGGLEITGGPAPGHQFNDRNVLLAWLVQRALKQGLGVEDRGVLRARYAVLRAAEMPAVLIEGGFMSHPAESKRIYEPGYRQQMARAIVAAVQAYKSRVEPAQH